MSAGRSEFLKYIDEKAESFIKRLGEAVAIPSRVAFRSFCDPTLTSVFSVSAEAKHRKDVLAMGQYLEKTLQKYGVETRTADLGTQHLEGQTIPLPPALLGRLGNDSAKKTILIYGHFDVQPVNYTRFRFAAPC